MMVRFSVKMLFLVALQLSRMFPNREYWEDWPRASGCAEPLRGWRELFFHSLDGSQPALPSTSPYHSLFFFIIRACSGPPGTQHQPTKAPTRPAEFPAGENRLSLQDQAWGVPNDVTIFPTSERACGPRPQPAPNKL